MIFFVLLAGPMVGHFGPSIHELVVDNFSRSEDQARSRLNGYLAIARQRALNYRPQSCRLRLVGEDQSKDGDRSGSAAQHGVSAKPGYAGSPSLLGPRAAVQ